MKYIYRGNIIFEYDPDDKYEKVKLGFHNEGYTNWQYCRLIPDDYKLLSEYFDIVYRHIQGEDVELKDMEVN